MQGECQPRWGRPPCGEMQAYARCRRCPRKNPQGPWGREGKSLQDGAAARGDIVSEAEIVHAMARSSRYVADRAVTISTSTASASYT